MRGVTVLQARKVENANLKPKKVGETAHSFTKRPNEDFRVLQLTDLHIGNGLLSRKSDSLAKNAIITLVERVKPDLIVITGDLVYPLPMFAGSIDNLKQSKVVGQLFETFGIPWTLTFGNHDSETFSKCDKTELLHYYQSLPNCLLRNDDNSISGVGNHYILINNENGSINTALFMVDSNMYLKKSFFSSFDNIHDDQIEWYKAKVKELSGERDIIRSLAFCHMPMIEYRDAWERLKRGKLDEVTYHLGTVGEINDHFGYSKNKEGHFFEEMVNLGSCKGIFCGHDHLNNISMTYKGIRLTYGMSIDFLAYPKITSKYTQRGGTVISIKDDGSFEVNLEPLTYLVENYK